MNNKISLITLFFLFSIFFTGCNYVDGEGNSSDNAVYMGVTDNQQIISFPIETTGGVFTLNPRLANITDTPVKMRIEHDPSVVENYNKINGTRYVALPASEFKLLDVNNHESVGGIDLQVNAGNFDTQMQVKIGKLDNELYPTNRKYAISLSITTASAYKLIPSQKSVILVLNRPLVTSVAKLSKGGINVKPAKVYSNPEWTIQMSALYSNLTRGNLTTAYIAGWAGSEFYTRISAKAGIQVKNGRDGDDTWTQIPLQANKWLHIAFVHKDRTIIAYVNGKVQKVFQTGDIWLNEKSSFQIGNDGYSNDYVREFRFWSKALTEAEINDNLYLPLDPETPNLEVYLPLTEKDGTRDLKAPENLSNVKVTATIEWIKNVKFPAEGLVIDGE